MVRIILISDMHGDDPTGRIAIEQKDNGIERVACLGDYDTPQVLRAVRKLRIPKVLTIGNHDIAYVNKIKTPPFIAYNTAGEYFQAWKNHRVEKELIINAFVKNIETKLEKIGRVVEDNIDGRKIVYAHASIVDGNAYDPAWKRQVEERLTFECDSERQDAFEKMAEQDYWIFFRGHDHGPQILSQAKDAKKNGNMIVGEDAEDTVKLRKDRRYIINPGAFVNLHMSPSCWAIFDSEASTITFKDLWHY